MEKNKLSQFIGTNKDVFVLEIIDSKYSLEKFLFQFEEWFWFFFSCLNWDAVGFVGKWHDSA